MSTCLPTLPPVASLRRRELVTQEMIADIDSKIARLGAARHERLAALNRIRCEIVRALKAEPVAPARHADQSS